MTTPIFSNNIRTTMRKVNSTSCAIEDDSAAQDYRTDHRTRSELQREEKNCFSALLRKPAASRINASSYNAISRNTHFSMRELASSPHFQVLHKKIDTRNFTVDSVHLRLINGPCAGLKIIARFDRERLIIVITTHHLQHFSSSMRPFCELTAMLANMCNCAVILEVQDAISKFD